MASEGGSHSPGVTAVSSGAGWGGSSDPSHGRVLVRPVLQHHSECHSWKLSQEPLLQASPDSLSSLVSF